MTIACVIKHLPLSRMLLVGALALVPLGAACAWQSTTPPSKPKPARTTVIVAPSPGVQFQQTVQQQQVRDQLQKNQMQQQLQQGVSNNAKLPMANNAAAQQQLDQATRAQQSRNQANQQSLLNQYQDAAALPRVVPGSQPAHAHSGG